MATPQVEGVKISTPDWGPNFGNVSNISYEENLLKKHGNVFSANAAHEAARASAGNAYGN